MTAGLLTFPPSNVPVRMSTDETIQAFNENRQEVQDLLRGLVKCRYTADDLTQETYLRVAGMNDAGSVRNWRAFILRIARNLAIDHLRVRGRRSQLEQLTEALDDVTDDRPAAGDALADEEGLRLLEAHLSDLPELSRRILELYRREGLSHPEIARDLGLSVRTVARHMAFAVSFLRERMQR